MILIIFLTNLPLLIKFFFNVIEYFADLLTNYLCLPPSTEKTIRGRNRN